MYKITLTNPIYETDSFLVDIENKTSVKNFVDSLLEFFPLKGRIDIDSGMIVESDHPFLDNWIICLIDSICEIHNSENENKIRSNIIVIEDVKRYLKYRKRYENKKLKFILILTNLLYEEINEKLQNS